MASLDTSLDQVRQRPGGRSARVREAVLAATLEELARTGAAPAPRIDGIARRAGVNKTTIYRRWGTVEALVTDALLTHGTAEVPVPDTGSARDDLVELLRALTAHFHSAVGRGLILRLITSPDLTPESAEIRRAFWDARLEATAEIVRREIARGGIRAEVDPKLVIEAVAGALSFRLLQTHEPTDDAFFEAITDLVLRGARP